MLPEACGPAGLCSRSRLGAQANSHSAGGHPCVSLWFNLKRLKETFQRPDISEELLLLYLRSAVATLIQRRGGSGGAFLGGQDVCSCPLGE